MSLNSVDLFLDGAKVQSYAAQLSEIALEAGSVCSLGVKTELGVTQP